MIGHPIYLDPFQAVYSEQSSAHLGLCYMVKLAGDIALVSKTVSACLLSVSVSTTSFINLIPQSVRMQKSLVTQHMLYHST